MAHLSLKDLGAALADSGRLGALACPMLALELHLERLVGRLRQLKGEAEVDRLRCLAALPLQHGCSIVTGYEGQLQLSCASQLQLPRPASCRR